MENKKPDLKTYLNVHQYLGDLYKYRKATEEYFSYETWSQELDIKNRSFLRQIVIGKRSLTSETTKLLCDRMGFYGIDREYFQLLVLYSKSSTQEQRNLYGRKLMQLIKTDHEQTEIENYYELISTPLYPKILTLLTFKDIRKDRESIARLLNTEAKEIEAGLGVLDNLKLICFNEESQEWQSTEKSVKVPDQIGDAALLDYHSKSLQEAIAAKSLPKDQRRYKALLLPLNHSEFAEFLEDLQGFVKQSLKKFDTDDLRTRKLHQVNFNIYAVSEEPEYTSEMEISEV
ncbi:MAG: TIGR02147 family protein [Bdellovibrio sp.]